MREYAADSFDFIRGRLQEIKREKAAASTPPPFNGASGAPGHHCTHCPMAADQSCGLGCSTEYKKLYGIDPHATQPAPEICSGCGYAKANCICCYC